MSIEISTLMEIEKQIENSRKKAEGCQCAICGEQAVAFWPSFDPDVIGKPYCKSCLNRVKVMTMINIEKAIHSIKHPKY